VEKLQAFQELLQAVHAHGDLFGDQGVRDAGVMKLVAQGNKGLDGLLHHRLLDESEAAPQMEINLEQLRYYQQVTLRMVLLQEVAQEPMPFAKRGIPQIVPQL
jgi:hypothetical protein